MLTAILMVLIAAVVIAFIAWPLVQATPSRPAAPGGADRLAELRAQRDATLKAIKDLEFDHQTGKVAAEDYPVNDRRLRLAALEAIQALDAFQAQAKAPRPPGGRRRAVQEAALETEISAARRKPAGVAARLDENLEKEIAAQRGRQKEAGRRFCRQCGQPLRAGDRYCGACGAAAA